MSDLDRTSEFVAKVEAAFQECYGGVLQRWVMPIIYTELSTMRERQDIINPEEQLVIDSLGLAAYAQASALKIVAGTNE